MNINNVMKIQNDVSGHFVFKSCKNVDTREVAFTCTSIASAITSSGGGPRHIRRVSAQAKLSKR